jgi:serine/threonine-protein kinase RsbW
VVSRLAFHASGATTIDLGIPSEFGWEAAVADLVRSIARRMGFAPDRIDDMRTALGEAVTNAIEHGNGQDRSKRVQVAFIPEETSLRILVMDESPIPFPPDLGERKPPSIHDLVAGQSPGRGWGTYLIRALVDEISFLSTGRGNVVQMVVRLRPDVESGAGQLRDWPNE